MDIQVMQLAQLCPAEYNPRKALKPGDKEYEKLKASLKNFGYVEPIIWNKQTGNVVGGHQRITVLLDLGITQADVVVVDMPLAKEKALNVALNKISGEWDFDKLRDVLSDLDDFDKALTGFDLPELDELFKDAITEKVHDDDFDVDAELKKPPITKTGDVWLLGRHRLICGDSTKESVIDELMAGNKANLVVTDPPYNVDYVGKNQGTHLKFKTTIGRTAISTNFY